MKHKPEIYEEVRRLVAEGLWRVDAEAGCVYSQYPGRWYGKVLGYVSGNGYVMVRVQINGRDAGALAHRVVWEAVYGPITDPLLEVNHINSVRQDNRIGNLELLTSSGNHLHAYRVGGRVAKGAALDAKLSAEEVRAIRDLIACGWGQRRVARLFAVNIASINAIVHGRHWAAVS